MTSQRKSADGLSHFFSGSEEQVLAAMAAQKESASNPVDRRYAITMQALGPVMVAAVADARAAEPGYARDVVAHGVAQALMSAAFNVLFNVYDADKARGLVAALFVHHNAGFKDGFWNDRKGEAE